MYNMLTFFFLFHGSKKLILKRGNKRLKTGTSEKQLEEHFATDGLFGNG